METSRAGLEFLEFLFAAESPSVLSQTLRDRSRLPSVAALKSSDTDDATEDALQSVVWAVSAHPRSLFKESISRSDNSQSD